MAAKNVTSTATKPTKAPAPSPVVTAMTATADTASITEDAKSSVVSGNVLANDSSGLTVTSVNNTLLAPSNPNISGTYGKLTIDGTISKFIRGTLGPINNRKPMFLGGKLYCDGTNVTCDYFAGVIDWVTLER